jgi:hypothetical protein
MRTLQKALIIKMVSVYSDRHLVVNSHQLTSPEFDTHRVFSPIRHARTQELLLWHKATFHSIDNKNYVALNFGVELEFALAYIKDEDAESLLTSETRILRFVLPENERQ